MAFKKITSLVFYGSRRWSITYCGLIWSYTNENDLVSVWNFEVLMIHDFDFQTSNGPATWPFYQN